MDIHSKKMDFMYHHLKLGYVDNFAQNKLSTINTYDDLQPLDLRITIDRGKHAVDLSSKGKSNTIHREDQVDEIDNDITALDLRISIDRGEQTLNHNLNENSDDISKLDAIEKIGINSQLIGVSTQTKVRGRKLGQKSNGIHLWEFLYGLLEGENKHPCIRWHNKVERIFLIEDTGKIAQLWGEKKNNIHMKYSYLSRSIRYCRKKGDFIKIPSHIHCPRKKCFRFGPQIDKNIDKYSNCDTI